MDSEGKSPRGQKRKIDDKEAQTDGETHKRLHDSFFADGGLPQSAGSCEDANSRLPAADVRDPEIQRLNNLLKQVHDQTVPLAKLVNFPATSIEQLPTLISSITKYLESNIVRYAYTDEAQEARQVVVEPIDQDGPSIASSQEIQGPAEAVNNLVLEDEPAIPFAKEVQETLQDVKETDHQSAPAAPSPEGSGAESRDDSDKADGEYMGSGIASVNTDDDPDDSVTSSKEGDHSDKHDLYHSPIGVRGRPPMKAPSSLHPPRRTQKAAHVVTPSRRPVYQGKQILLSP